MAKLHDHWEVLPHGPLREAWLHALAAQSLPVLRAPASVDTARWLAPLNAMLIASVTSTRGDGGTMRARRGGKVRDSVLRASSPCSSVPASAHLGRPLPKVFRRRRGHASEQLKFVRAESRSRQREWVTQSVVKPIPRVGGNRFRKGR